MFRTRPRRKTFSPWMEKQCWERFAALSCRAGTSLVTILNSFATMVPWRKTSLRLSATTDRTDRHGDDDQLGRPGGDSYDRRAGAREAHGGAKAEGGADCSAGIESRRAKSEACLL